MTYITKNLYYFCLNFRDRKIIAQTHTNPILKTAEKAHSLLKWLFELKLSVDHLPTLFNTILKIFLSFSLFCTSRKIIDIFVIPLVQIVKKHLK